MSRRKTPLNIKLDESAIREATTYAGRVTGPVALADQPLIAPASVPASQVKIFSVDENANLPLASYVQSVAQRPSADIRNILRSGVASAKTVARSKAQPTLTQNPHHALLLSKPNWGGKYWFKYLNYLFVYLTISFAELIK